VFDQTYGGVNGLSDRLKIQVASDAANAEVPEPGSLALLGIGVAAVVGSLGLVCYRWRRTFCVQPVVYEDLG
jgi:hypothetical protein